MSSQDNSLTDFLPETVLNYWFAGSENNAGLAADRMPFWFQSDAKADEEIKKRFGAFIQPASEGDYSDWGKSPRECLALIILLDQFPRNVYRNTAKAFEFDALALGLSIVGTTLGFVDELSPIEQTFFLMPYQHTEDLSRQQEGFGCYERVLQNAAPEWQSLIAGSVDFARQHLEIIEQFGRFPHRNAVLGRSSTPEEEAYIAAGGATFGQGS